MEAGTTAPHPAAPRVGVVGLGRQGRVDLKAMRRLTAVTALCDVDGRALAEATALAPEAEPLRDWRRLVHHPDVDAVVVCTPDHHHAPITLEALALGKPCFCQKPLAMTVGEVRRVAAATRASGAATQLCLQGLAHARAARSLEIVRSGLIGAVSEVHVWTDRPGDHWPLAGGSAGAEPPAWLDWDAWLGPSAPRPYRPEYHPSGWRAWVGLGTGPLGDMGVHNAALAFWALGLGPPRRVDGTWSPPPASRFPESAELTFELTSASGRSVTMRWYHGGRVPDEALFDEIRCDDNGCLLVGEEGRCYLPGSMNQYLYLLPTATFRDVPRPDGGTPPDIYEEWLAACRTGAPTRFAFDGFCAALNEALLVGNLAFAAGGAVEWDAERATTAGDREWGA